MPKPERPSDESARLDVLRRYAILDTPPEAAYDDLLAIAAGICGTPMGAVSLVDAERQWFKASLGLPMIESPRDESFCACTILDPDRLMIVADAREDTRFSAMPHVTGEPHFRFYAGAPLVGPSGQVTGALCVMDRQPRELNAFQCESLLRLSRQVVMLMELRRANRQLQQDLEDREWYEHQLREYQRLLEQHNDELATELDLDVLTGLRNRRAFAADLNLAITRAAMREQSLVLAVIDIDHFKAINDTHGHLAGDQMLAQVGRILKHTAQSPVVAARQGGEEFVLLMPEHDLEQARALSESVRSQLREADLSVPLTVSIGLAVWRIGESANELYAHADGALYAAKRAGRDCVVVATSPG